jgi:hypothetical protein
MKDLQGSLSNRYMYNPKGLPCYTRTSEHIGISPAGEGWTVANGNMTCLVAALTCNVIFTLTEQAPGAVQEAAAQRTPGDTHAPAIGRPGRATRNAALQYACVARRQRVQGPTARDEGRTRQRDPGCP